MTSEGKANPNNSASWFGIAGFSIKVAYASSETNNDSLLPNMATFKQEPTSKSLFSLEVDDALALIPKEQRHRIDIFDTGNGDTIVDKTVNGYQFIMKDTQKRPCCLLQTNADFTKFRCALNGSSTMRSFGLNNSLMMAFAFRSSFYNTLLIHASLVRCNDYGYAFIAKSGTGKSTHTSLWLKHIKECDLMNDDNPIIRITNGTPYIYGSPWSGKTPCYRNIKAKLGAITQIDRASENSIGQLLPTEAFSRILPSCSSMKWDKTIFRNTYDTIIKLIECSDSNYILHCRPDKEAAILCHQTIAK